MALRRTLVVFALFGSSVVATAQGCQEPTQVTLELSLDRKATCAEIASGTSIAVGVEPFDTESRIASGFVTARTNDCDPATNRIGTLVVTPNERGRAAVVVVVGYKDNDPTSCKPPLYAGCIVARRSFAFAEHTRLRMPIQVDPDCAGVPCDAFSTCNKGRCYSSETSCSGTTCETPGELADGGVDEAGIVEPDASGIDDGGPDDGAKDAGEDVSVPPGSVVSCDSDGLVCAGQRCTVSSPLCCITSAGGYCSPACPATVQACCVDGSAQGCPSGHVCRREAGQAVGRCAPAAGTFCTVDDQVICDGITCAAGQVCCGAMAPTCAAACAVMSQQRCCATNQKDVCPFGSRCVRTDTGVEAGSCVPNAAGSDSGVMPF